MEQKPQINVELGEKEALKASVLVVFEDLKKINSSSKGTLTGKFLKYLPNREGYDLLQSKLEVRLRRLV